MDERRKIFGAMEENNLEVTMEVLRKGTHIDKDEDRSDRTLRTGA